MTLVDLTQTEGIVQKIQDLHMADVEETGLLSGPFVRFTNA